MITCTFEDGDTTSLRHVVIDIFIINNNKILLVRRAPHLLNGGKLGLIGGYVNRDETIEEAVIREALEETGYKVKIEKFLRVNDNPNRPQEDRQNISFNYLASPIEKVAEHDDESTDVQWYSLDSLPDESEFAFDHFESIKLYLAGKL